MVVAILGLLIAAADPMTALPMTPIVDRTCVGSPAHLGTDNAPFEGQTVRTSINDMSVWLAPDSGRAVAWVYHNRLKEDYVFANRESIAWLQRALTPTQFAEYAKRAVYVLAGKSQLSELDASFAKIGISRSKCFTSPLPERYFTAVKQ